MKATFTPEDEVWTSPSGVKVAFSGAIAEDVPYKLSPGTTAGLTVITGGPGTGKTTVVKAIIALAEQEGLNILLCAPTGRAAKRLAETTQRKAKTIHRLLGPAGYVGPHPLFNNN